MTHTSGLPNVPKEARGRDYAPSDLADYLRRETVGEPGRFRYSSTGYATLALLMQEQFSLDYKTVVAEQIFGPLGMSDATFNLGPSTRPREVQGWRRGKKAEAGPTREAFAVRGSR